MKVLQIEDMEVDQLAFKDMLKKNKIYYDLDIVPDEKEPQKKLDWKVT